MKYDPISRRMFLMGSGTFLAIPLLKSLLPSSAWAADEPRKVCYIQIITLHGTSRTLWYGDMPNGATPIAGLESVVRRPLSSINGPLSDVLGNNFNSLKNKISILQGLDTIVSNDNHHYLFPTTASSYDSGLNEYGAPPTTRQMSIDQLIAASSKVYPANFPNIRRHINIGSGSSFSWHRSSAGEVYRPSPLTATNAILSLFSAGLTNGAPTSADPKKTNTLNAVFNDYKSVRDNPRLSANHRLVLEEYMTRVSDIIAEENQTPVVSASCNNPTLNETSNLRNQMKILVAAMQCGLTRVANINVPITGVYNVLHDEHHAMGTTNREAGFTLSQENRKAAAEVAFLLQQLEAAKIDGFSMLDNSIVYWGMQYGVGVRLNPHTGSDMSVMVAGGAGGKLNQGNYISYLNTQNNGTICNDASLNCRVGVPMNNLLVTFANCMGLSSVDYEKTPGQGYGYYRVAPEANGRSIMRLGTNLTLDKIPRRGFYGTTEGRRTPLPGLYQGPFMG